MNKPTTTRISEAMLGALMVAFVYAFLTPRLFPDVVSWPEGLPNGTVAALRWLVGIAFGVLFVAVWHVARGAIGRSGAAH